MDGNTTWKLPVIYNFFNDDPNTAAWLAVFIFIIMVVVFLVLVVALVRSNRKSSSY